jgi:hypothetical protein
MALKAVLFLFFFLLTEVFSEKINLKEYEINKIKREETIIKEIKTKEKGKTFEATALIKGTPKEIKEILMDFEKYPEFMPDVSAINVKERKENKAIVDYTLTLPLDVVKKYRLELLINKFEKGFNLSWKKIPWPGLESKKTIPDTQGFWLVNEFEGKKGYSIVKYYVYTDPGEIMWGLGWIVDFLTEKSLPKLIDSLRHRVKKLYYTK